MARQPDDHWKDYVVLMSSARRELLLLLQDEACPLSSWRFYFLWYIIPDILPGTLTTQVCYEHQESEGKRR